MTSQKKNDVDTSDAQVVPNIGVPRAETSEEIRQREDAGDVSKAAPYPADPKEAHKIAVEASERQADAPEFDTSDIQGHTVEGKKATKKDKKGTVVIRLLYDWWDGQGVRHPLNTEVEVPLNEARKLVDERKAERTDKF